MARSVKSKRRSGHVPEPRVPSMPSGGADPAGWVRAAIPLMVLLVAVVAAFGRTLGYGLLDWDDPTNVSANPLVMSPSWENFGILWTRPYVSLYIPMVYSSYLVDLLVGQGSFAALHAGNLVYHFLASVVVYHLVRQLTGRSDASLLGALLFATHPLQTESVAWVTGRKDVLSGLFMLLAVLQFDRWLTHSTGRTYAIATAAFVLALLAKPSVVVAPLMAVLLCIYRSCPVRKAVRGLWLWFVLAAVWAALTSRLQSDVTLAPFWLPLWKRPFVAADSLFFYVEKLFFPAGLAAVYPITNRTLFESPLVWLELPAVLLVLAVLVRQRGIVALAAGFFVLPLLPVLGFTPFFYQFHSNVADRYCYVSLAAAGLGLAGALAAMIARFPRVRIPAMGAGAVLTLMFVTVSYRQSGFWKDPRTLWTRVLEIDPRSTSAMYNLGMYYAEHDLPEQALALFRLSVQVDPSFARGHINLILMTRRMNRKDEARAAAQAALRLKPVSQDDWLAVGHARAELGDFQNAAAAFLEAVKQVPDDAEAHDYLGLAFMDLRDFTQAEKAFREAMRLDPLRESYRTHLDMCQKAAEQKK